MASQFDAAEIQRDMQAAVQIALVGLLLEQAKSQDPDFPAKARARFDYVLGRYHPSEPPRMVELTAEIRKRVLEFIDDPSRLVSEGKAKPRTLKRRFLNWLESD